MKISLLTISCFFLLHANLNSQSTAFLDSIFNTLKNEEIFVSPKFGGGTFLSEQEIKNLEELKSEGMVFPRKSCTVASFPMDFSKLERDYPRRSVVRKLYNILCDESRDFYAHALLTELFFPDKLCKFWRKTSKTWKESGESEKDKRLWELFLSKEGYISNVDVSE